jgi:hypothetical protein
MTTNRKSITNRFKLESNMFMFEKSDGKWYFNEHNLSYVCVSLTLRDVISKPNTKFKIVDQT